MNINEFVERTLRNTLIADDVYSFYQKADEIVEGKNEFIVYTLGDSDGYYADNDKILKNINITIRYYYKDILLKNFAKAKTERENQIVKILNDVGIRSFGEFRDVGDIDDIGYFVSVGEFVYGANKS